ncbi:MAG: hypothetical protein GWN58_07755 [Anaerolineae bacterium]|nr:hypothetical protein [Anaerolineae bacterium]
MEANPLDPIRQMVTAGEQRGARIALSELLEAEPDNADAWALLAILLTDPAEQALCYHEILRINPDDRQAAAWLESLSGAAAESPGGEQYPGEESPGPQSTIEQEQLDRVLDEVVLPGKGAAIPPPRIRQEATQRQAEPKGFLNGLMDRLRSRATGPDPESEAFVLGQEEAQSAGSLSPELILRLAGGPLPSKERRNCPKCDAVVSRREEKCPWCSAPLPALEDQ